jgi:hypothetical protein
MGMEGPVRTYAPPVVLDLGDLTALTRSSHLVLGQAGISDLSFSSPNGGVGGVSASDPGIARGGAGGDTTGGGDFTGTAGGGGGAGGVAAGGGTGGGGAGGGGGGGGGKLPFTGFAAGAAAAIGSALVAGGVTLRRLVGRRRSDG